MYRPIIHLQYIQTRLLELPQSPIASLRPVLRVSADQQQDSTGLIIGMPTRALMAEAEPIGISPVLTQCVGLHPHPQSMAITSSALGAGSPHTMRGITSSPAMRGNHILRTRCGQSSHNAWNHILTRNAWQSHPPPARGG